MEIFILKFANNRLKHMVSPALSERMFYKQNTISSYAFQLVMYIELPQIKCLIHQLQNRPAPISGAGWVDLKRAERV